MSAGDEMTKEDNRKFLEQTKRQRARNRELADAARKHRRKIAKVRGTK